MSAVDTEGGSEVSRTTSRNSEAQRRGHQATVSDSTATRSSESKAVASGLELLSHRRSGKGRLNVSEASVVAPESSDILAQGQVFIPPHEHSSEQAADSLHDHSEKPHKETEGASDDPATSTEGHKDEEPPTSTEVVSTGKEREGISEASKPARRPSHLFTLSESAIEVIAESFGKFGVPRHRGIPEIRVHRPSGTVMAASLGTTAMNSTNDPATPVPSAADQSPAAPSSTPLGGLPGADAVPVPVPIDPSAVTGVVGTATSALPAVPLPVPGLPAGSKGGRKKKIIGKARKLVLRKRVLAVILGKELAGVVHSQLSTVGNVADGVPLPVDGPSDMIHVYTRRKERKRDIRRREMDQKIARARIHAEAEEVHRCRICSGLTRTSCLRRYHRLQLKRDRPDMSELDRRATAMARVAAFKCKCRKRILGVQNEATSHDAMTAQHLRAPAAIEQPLARVDGACKP